ncbi:hypothetical protein [Negativicoccus succinicivorans]|uniref:hypothetical protein n=1 Tax=Negativicoccus succinicivorans TaxID=620903 RepID=UPI002915857D|nr:hypothetical protein [Negativicoccus succinicivorans]MDU5287670.1 hypothetical protein [Negativicoccus succinicivorans]
MKRRRKLTAVQRLVLALIFIHEHWRTIGAAIGGALMLIGAANLITAEVELYVDYSVALKYLAKSWGAIIGGGILTSLCVDFEEVTR